MIIIKDQIEMKTRTHRSVKEGRPGAGSERSRVCWKVWEQKTEVRRSERRGRTSLSRNRSLPAGGGRNSGSVTERVREMVIRHTNEEGEEGRREASGGREVGERSRPQLLQQQLHTESVSDSHYDLRPRIT